MVGVKSYVFNKIGALILRQLQYLVLLQKLKNHSKANIHYNT